MATPTVVEETAKLINEKLEALDVRTSDERLKELINEVFEGIEPDNEFVRKIRFAGGDPRLEGSKFGRMGLGVADIEFLYQLTDAAGAARLGPGPSEDLTKAYTAVTEGRMLDAVSAQAADMHTLETMLVDGRLNKAQFVRARESAARAMDTAETGFGLQLIGNQYVGELWAGAYQESRIMSTIPQFSMTDPTAFLPVPGALPEMLFVGESTASNSSAYTTSKTPSQRVQVDAKKFIIHQMWSGEMDEDSIIPFIPFLRQQAQMGLAHYMDSAILNGDTTNAGTGNINLDDADPADTKHYLAYDGLRHVGIVDNTDNGTDAAGVLTYSKLTAMRKLGLDAGVEMDWGHPSNPADWIYLVDPNGGDDISDLDEVVTVDKYGSNATVQTGEVANIGRNPLISTVAMSKTEADGKVSTTGSNNTQSQVVAYNRLGFTLGIRRQLQIKTEDIIETDQQRIVYSLRNGFGRFSPTGAASGIEAAGVLYNI